MTYRGGGVEVEDLLGLALRHNPRRAHLLVSTVLGKHLPAAAATTVAVGVLLGRRVRAALTGAAHTDDLAAVVRDPHAAAALLRERPAGPAPLGPVRVVGYAETATALGHAVWRGLAAPDAAYCHSTRWPGVDPPALEFREEHSHATAHRVLTRPGFFADTDTVVLVDDELSTGRTALNTLRALRALAPVRHAVLAALVDVRPVDVQAACRAEAASLGIHLDTVALLTAPLTVRPADPTGRSRTSPPEPRRVDPAVLAEARRSGRLVERVLPWPGPTTARHGWTWTDEAAALSAAAAAAATLPVGARPVVVGTEELMWLPQLLAVALGPTTLTLATTRSPVVICDEPGYAVRRGLHAADPHEPHRTTRLHNLPVDATDVVVVLAPDPVDPAPLLGAVLSAVPAARVHALTLAAAPPPRLGSYPGSDVTFLLTDVTGRLPLLDPAQREAAIQAGRHYSEMVPAEYLPGPDYQTLFHASLATLAPRLAVWAGAVTELLLAEDDPPVLASLARAGTPAGILLRRYAALRHGLDLPHYSISIVRGRGLDRVALAHLLAAYPGRPVRFVDGWTGKGAIARQLAVALDRLVADGGPRLDDRLAVLADPGGCTPLHGTREDVLIPSAALNATVSGLLSRTIVNAKVLAPGDFHGVHRFDALAGADVSRLYVDTVTAVMPASYAEVDRTVELLRSADRTPGWTGWQAVERIAERFGLTDLNLVKPGVGETSRVLLRRVPWQVLIRPDSTPDLDHLRWLARDRGVPLVHYPDMPYRAVGLIRPLDRAD